MDELIYQRPADYELEHEGNADDVEFFVALARRLKPKRVFGSCLRQWPSHPTPSEPSRARGF